jgi:hypothetical protein
MKITFDDTINKRDWLHSCLLSSLTTEAINSGIETRSYEVKLLVNGIELEPTHLNDLLTNVEKHIDNEAKTLFYKTYTEPAERLRLKMNRLEDIIKEAKDKIINEFNITEEED